MTFFDSFIIVIRHLYLLILRKYNLHTMFFLQLLNIFLLSFFLTLFLDISRHFIFKKNNFMTFKLNFRNFGVECETRLFSWFLFVPSEFVGLFEAGRDRLSVTLSLLLNRQYRLVGPLVSLCRRRSRCDIHPVTADTAKASSESTKGTKKAFWGQKYPEVIYNIPFWSKWNLQ